MLPGMEYIETGGTSTEIAAPPTDANLALHMQKAHLQMILWMAADKSDRPDVQLNDYGWEVKEHEHVMPAISLEPLHHRYSWTSSGAAAKWMAKYVVEGVAIDPMKCRVPVTVSVEEACLL